MRVFARKPRGMFYLYNSQAQDSDGFSDLVVRAQGPPEALIDEIRAAIHSEDANLAIAHVGTLREQVDSSLGEEMVLAKLAGFFGVVALLLASIGLYGVIAYSVARRTNEIGVRMALGAQPTNVMCTIMGESMVLVLIGFAAGLPAALACGQLVSSQLYGVPAHDPVTFAAAIVILLLVGFIAAFQPARRAALLDPVAALRRE
jgi:ABC-type antimicrobial peptide transport system permease subunit